MEIKLINYLLLTYQMRHGNSVEEGDTERERERERERESGRETGRGWSWLESGERWREPRDRERERATERVERRGEARPLESGLWRVLERPRQREPQSDGERLESGERWQSALSTQQSALRQSALEWVKAASGPESSGSCWRKKKGRWSTAAWQGAEEEEKGGS